MNIEQFLKTINIDTALCEMDFDHQFWCMPGPYRAYFELPIAVPPPETPTVIVRYEYTLIKHICNLWDYDSREHAEAYLVQKMYDTFMEIRKVAPTAEEGAEAYLFWRYRYPHVFIEPAEAEEARVEIHSNDLLRIYPAKTKPGYLQIKTRIAVPGVDLSKWEYQRG